MADELRSMVVMVLDNNDESQIGLTAMGDVTLYYPGLLHRRHSIKYVCYCG